MAKKLTKREKYVRDYEIRGNLILLLILCIPIPFGIITTIVLGFAKFKKMKAVLLSILIMLIVVGLVINFIIFAVPTGNYVLGVTIPFAYLGFYSIVPICAVKLCHDSKFNKEVKLIKQELKEGTYSITYKEFDNTLLQLSKANNYQGFENYVVETRQVIEKAKAQLALQEEARRKEVERFAESKAGNITNIFTIRNKYEFDSVCLTIYNNVKYLEGRGVARKIVADLKEAYKNNNNSAVEQILEKYSYNSVLKIVDLSESEFKGNLVKYYFHKWYMAFLGFFLFNWLTLGWLKYHRQVVDKKYYVKNTVIDGYSLKFDGNSLQAWGLAIKIWFFNIITLGLYNRLFKKSKNDTGSGTSSMAWAAKHTRITEASSVIRGTFDGSGFKFRLLKLLCAIGTICTLFIGATYFTCVIERYKAKHTVYDGKRLYFDGTAKELFTKNLLWALLTICTLFIYYFISKYKMEKWVIQHTHFASGVNMNKKDLKKE